MATLVVASYDVIIFGNFVIRGTSRTTYVGTKLKMFDRGSKSPIS